MSKPCDRIEILSGQYVPRCDCGNSGDLMMATMWCAEKNDAPIKDALERENARLREEVEMLNVRHAAAMLHAQTHADEYNALREDEKGLLQDIQRLTEEAFKRDEKLAIQSNANVGLMEELAEAKRELDDVKGPQFTKRIDIVTKTFRDRAEQAEARALANEKDAGRYRWLRGGNSGLPQNWALPWGDALDAAIDAAIGANFDTAIDSALKASAQEGQ